MRIVAFITMMALAVLTGATSFAQTTPTVAGTWSGVLTYKSGPPVLFVVRFEQRGSTLTGVAASPYQNNGTSPIDSVTQHGTTLDFTIASFGVTFNGTIGAHAIDGTFTQRGIATPLTLIPSSGAPDLVGTWIGMLHVGGAQLLMGLRISRNGTGALTAVFDSPAQNAFGLPTSSFLANAQKLSFSILDGAASFTGNVTPDAITGTFTQSGESLPLTFERPQIGEAVQPEPTALPTEPPHFTSRDVRFHSSGGVTLAGTLTVPENAHGRLPAFVFVHGSGPEDRNGAVKENPTFLDLSNALSNAGVVVLRYDKRGIGQSTGKATEDWHPLATDARAALAFLRAQPRVDPKRVFLLGHSEGGLIVPLVALHDRHLAGIVLLAPPAIPMNQVMAQQLSRATPQMRKIMSKQIAQAFASYAGIDPVNVIAHVSVPILILQGSKDLNVLPGDLQRLLAAERPFHKKITARVLSGDDHLFINVPPGHAPGWEFQLPEPLDPRVASDMLTWMRSIVADPPRR